MSGCSLKSTLPLSAHPHSPSSNCPPPITDPPWRMADCLLRALWLKKASLSNRSRMGRLRVESTWDQSPNRQAGGLGDDADSGGRAVRLPGLGPGVNDAGLFLSGCMSRQLQFTARRTINALPELQYQQVVDNLAKIGSNPGFLPYLAVVGQGSVQVTDNGNSSMGLNMASKVFGAGTFSVGRLQCHRHVEPGHDHQSGKNPGHAGGYLQALRGRPRAIRRSAG